MTERWSFLLERPEITIPRERLESVLTGRRILVTGAAGSVGTALAHLTSTFAPEKLVLVDSHEASLARLGREIEQAGAPVAPACVLGDVRDRRKVRQIFRRFGIETVFHLAAYKQVPLGESNADQVLDVNILGTANVVAAARELGVKTLVYPSTDKAVQPSSLYGASKRIVERFLLSTAIDPVGPAIRAVRLVNVFGTQGSVIEIFARQIALNRPIEVTDPAMDRYWITMGEALQLIVAAAGRPTFEGIHLLDVGEPVPLLRTAERLYQHLRPGAAPPSVTIIGARPGERLHEQLVLPDERVRPTDVAGLLVVELPPLTETASDWQTVFCEVRDRLFELEPADLREWAFGAALAGPGVRLPEATDPRPQP